MLARAASTDKFVIAWLILPLAGFTISPPLGDIHIHHYMLETIDPAEESKHER